MASLKCRAVFVRMDPLRVNSIRGGLDESRKAVRGVWPGFVGGFTRGTRRGSRRGGTGKLRGRGLGAGGWGLGTEEHPLYGYVELTVLGVLVPPVAGLAVSRLDQPSERKRRRAPRIH